MDLEQALEFVRTRHRAVLATLKSDGTPQLSPVTVGADTEGHVIVSSRETAYKVRNLRRDPRVWVCVFPDQFFGEWVQLEGRAEVVALPDALPGLEDYYRGISGEHPDWADYRAAMERERRVLVRIELVKAGPDRSG
ncbi:MAG TPA: PPOX class F420-dependent oxidoreductase [Pseudonocardia sp.]|jgi:PPOX class probable F420-dependent enzyme|uniref:PPOX class F420-dependent oxidoreductase n=1 Tax=Pseudonocardia sp. TaxID=60912 RepID=UPI002ED877FB